MIQINKNVSEIKKDSYVSKKITETLLKLLKNHKLNEISISFLCDIACVGRASFYRNFNSKEEIIKNYLSSITDKFIKTSKILYTPDNFNDYLIKLFTHLEKNKEIGILLYKSNMIHYLKDEFDRIFLAKATNDNNKYHYAFISGGLYNLYYYWIKNNCKESPQELSKIFNDFYILKGGSK